MRPTLYRQLRLLPAAAAAAGLLAACGGGGGTSPDDYAQPSNSTSSGVAVDGYLAGTTVVCDADGNGAAGAGERAVGTGSAGRFVFEPACESALAAFGGSSVDTGLALVGTLRAPAGATVISPLTTLLAAGLANDRALAAFGLSAGTDLARTDPAAATGGTLAQPALMKATLVAQQLLAQAAGTFARLAGNGDADTVRQLYTVTADAFAQALAEGPALVADGRIQADRLEAALTLAARRANAALPFAGAVQPATLAAVMAPGLAAQAGTLLDASGGALADAARTAQSSTVIADFVLAHVAALAAARGATSDALAAELLRKIDLYVALKDDTFELVTGAQRVPLTLPAFESEAGVAITWPMAEPTRLEFALDDLGGWVPPAGQTMRAAITIAEADTSRHGLVQATIDRVAIARTTAGLRLSVPADASAVVYGVSSDGARKAVVNFNASVRGVMQTLGTAAGSRNSLTVGNAVTYAVNQLSNDFTGLYALRGAYRVTLVLDGVPLRRADGSVLPTTSITVPTKLDGTGAASSTVTVTGRGIAGTLRLTD